MSESDVFAQFSNIVETLDDVRDVIGEPPAAVVDKVVTSLDALCREFIAASPFCLIASSGADGHIDISPKGDPAGFVRVISDTLIAIPDRPGNRRVDTFHNVLENDRVGLIFLVPGAGETFRVRGRARIVRDESLLSTMAVNGKAPRLSLVVHVEEAFLHCPKCVIRSRMWQPEAWGDTHHLVDITRSMIEHAKANVSREENLEWAKKNGFLDLY